MFYTKSRKIANSVTKLPSPIIGGSLCHVPLRYKQPELKVCHNVITMATKKVQRSIALVWMDQRQIIFLTEITRTKRFHLKLISLLLESLLQRL